MRLHKKALLIIKSQDRIKIFYLLLSSLFQSCELKFLKIFSFFFYMKEDARKFGHGEIKLSVRIEYMLCASVEML